MKIGCMFIVYNEVVRLRENLDMMVEAFNDVPEVPVFTILDMYSTDGTWESILDFKHDHPDIEVITMQVPRAYFPEPWWNTTMAICDLAGTSFNLYCCPDTYFDKKFIIGVLDILRLEETDTLWAIQEYYVNDEKKMERWDPIAYRSWSIGGGVLWEGYVHTRGVGDFGRQTYMKEPKYDHRKNTEEIQEDERRYVDFKRSLGPHVAILVINGFKVFLNGKEVKK